MGHTILARGEGEARSEHDTHPGPPDVFLCLGQNAGLIIALTAVLRVLDFLAVCPAFRAH